MNRKDLPTAMSERVGARAARQALLCGAITCALVLLASVFAQDVDGVIDALTCQSRCTVLLQAGSGQASTELPSAASSAR